MDPLDDRDNIYVLPDGTTELVKIDYAKGVRDKAVKAERERWRRYFEVLAEPDELVEQNAPVFAPHAFEWRRNQAKMALAEMDQEDSAM